VIVLILRKNMSKKEDLGTLIEAILFVSDAPVTSINLLNILLSKGYVNEMGGMDELLDALIELKERYLDERYCYELREIAGGYQLLTKAIYGEVVKEVVQLREGKRLSKAALEVLSIVAYKQPVTRGEIDFIRGVASDYAVGKLLEKGLIEIWGRAELPGSPMLYKTTGAFMEYFGLRNMGELPKLEEFKEGEMLLLEAFENRFKI